MNPSIKEITLNDKHIFLIGTAHVSSVSANDVKECLQEVKPDSVCIELDQERYDSLNNPDKWKETNIIDVIKQKKSGYLLANLVLSAYQKRIAKKMDVKTGQEMICAIDYAKENDTNLVLADRNIQVTFRRIYRKHSFWQKVKLIAALISSMFDDQDISEADIENLKNSNVLEASLKEISKQFPVVSEVLIDERNKFLSQNIRNAKGNTIVAIVGAAHVPGILQYIHEDMDIEEYNVVPDKKLSSKIISWVIPLAIIVMIVSMFTRNPSLGWNQILAWILWNGSLSAIGTLIALGSPLAILTSFIAAPITSLNPLLAAGWFAGIVQAYIHKPKVKDLDTLTEDAVSIKGIYRNKFTHVLLIVILANVFSTIGTIIGGFDVVKNFFSMLL